MVVKMKNKSYYHAETGVC